MAAVERYANELVPGVGLGKTSDVEDTLVDDSEERQNG
jgi:hypothetical protein